MIPSAPLSIWLDEHRVPWPDLHRDERVSVLVVGAGLTGATIAMRLAACGQDVLLIDAHGPAASASGRNGGFVLLSNASEYPQFRARFGIDAARDVLALARRNREIIATEFGQLAEFEPTGSLMLALSRDDRAEQDLVLASQLLTADGVQNELGKPKAPLSGYGLQLRIPEDGQLHPARLVAALQAGPWRRARATLQAIDFDARRAECANGREIHFRTLVLATNAHTGALWPRLVGRIVPQRGQMLATAPIHPRILVEACYADQGYDYFRQRSDGRIVLGGQRHRFFVTEATDQGTPTAPVQAALDELLARHLPFARGAEVTHRWAGTMGFSADGLPYVDWADDRTVLVAGYTGHGLGLAVGLGDLVARALTHRHRLDEREERLLALFAPHHPSRAR